MVEMSVGRGEGQEILVACVRRFDFSRLALRARLFLLGLQVGEFAEQAGFLLL